MAQASVCAVATAVAGGSAPGPVATPGGAGARRIHARVGPATSPRSRRARPSGTFGATPGKLVAISSARAIASPTWPPSHATGAHHQPRRRPRAQGRLRDERHERERRVEAGGRQRGQRRRMAGGRDLRGEGRRGQGEECPARDGRADPDQARPARRPEDAPLDQPEQRRTHKRGAEVEDGEDAGFGTGRAARSEDQEREEEQSPAPSGASTRSAASARPPAVASTQRHHSPRFVPPLVAFIAASLPHQSAISRSVRRNQAWRGPPSARRPERLQGVGHQRSDRDRRGNPQERQPQGRVAALPAGGGALNGPRTVPRHGDPPARLERRVVPCRDAAHIVRLNYHSHA